MEIFPIKSAADHKKALKRIEELWEAEPNSPEDDELEILVTLVEAYEEIHYPIGPPDPIEAIKYRMEQQAIEPADLVQYLGSKSRVSEILNRKRKLTIDMIRKLHAGLGISLETLVQDYKLSL
ncbi:MAG: DNA-binding protein [Bacteroidota bacterium]